MPLLLPKILLGLMATWFLISSWSRAGVSFKYSMHFSIQHYNLLGLELVESWQSWTEKPQTFLAACCSQNHRMYWFERAPLWLLSPSPGPVLRLLLRFFLLTWQCLWTWFYNKATGSDYFYFQLSFLIHHSHLNIS